MLSIIGVKLKDYKGSIPMMIIMTVMALVFIYVFGVGFDQNYLPEVAIVDEDQTDVSKRYIEELMKKEGFNYEKTSLEEGLALTEEGKKIAVVLVKKGFEEGLSTNSSEVVMYRSGEAIEHYTLQANIESIAMLFTSNENYYETTLLMYKSIGINKTKEEMAYLLKDSMDNYPIVTVEVVSYQDSSTKGYDSMKHSFIGFILFFSMFTMVFGIGSIVDEKENRVWHRQVVSPISSASILAGNMIVSFVMGLFQLGFMVIFSKLVFGIDWGGSLVALILVLGAFVLAVTCLGLFISGLVRTQQQLGAISPVIIVSTSMIGGCMWPLSIVSSKVLLFLADLTPQRWAYRGLEEVIINNGTLADVTMPLIYLLIIAAIFFVLALVPYKRALSE